MEWYTAVAAGIVQLIIALILAVVALYIALSVLGRITRGIEEEKEIAKGNAAVGILVASVFIAIAYVVQSGVLGISVAISSLDPYKITVGFLQLILGIILAIVAIYIALSVLDRITKGIDEFEELRKGNVAVALEMAAVIIATAIIVQSGVIGITSALFPG